MKEFEFDTGIDMTRLVKAMYVAKKSEDRDFGIKVAQKISRDLLKVIMTFNSASTNIEGDISETLQIGVWKLYHSMYDTAKWLEDNKKCL